MVAASSQVDQATKFWTEKRLKVLSSFLIMCVTPKYMAIEQLFWLKLEFKLVMDSASHG